MAWESVGLLEVEWAQVLSYSVMHLKGLLCLVDAKSFISGI